MSVENTSRSHKQKLLVKYTLQGISKISTSTVSWSTIRLHLYVTSVFTHRVIMNPRIMWTIVILILKNVHCCLTLFIVIFANKALGHKTHTQRWRHRTESKALKQIHTSASTKWKSLLQLSFGEFGKINHGYSCISFICVFVHITIPSHPSK